ncbi:MAG: hypothetical protein F6K42_31460 [Leptolyngbya sp. SIO1D8]|nr:hypothetical protein [Leptolyngbya sp. SIO1D8]
METLTMQLSAKSKEGLNHLLALSRRRRERCDELALLVSQGKGNTKKAKELAQKILAEK